MYRNGRRRRHGIEAGVREETAAREHSGAEAPRRLDWGAKEIYSLLEFRICEVRVRRKAFVCDGFRLSPGKAREAGASARNRVRIATEPKRLAEPERHEILTVPEG